MNVTIGAMSNGQYVAWQTGSRATPAPIVDEDTDLFTLIMRLIAKGCRLACIVGEAEAKGAKGQTLRIAGVVWPGAEAKAVQMINGQWSLLPGKEMMR